MRRLTAVSSIVFLAYLFLASPISFLKTGDKPTVVSSAFANVSVAEGLNQAGNSTVSPALSELQPAVSDNKIFFPAIARLTNYPRGYLTTPEELSIIKSKADQGIEPYKSAVDNVFTWASKSWDYQLDLHETCANSDDPAWNDELEGTPILYAKALALHLSNQAHYAEEVKLILQRIMTEVQVISVEESQCRLNFAWGVPELVAAADLIEGYWKERTCTGPLRPVYGDTTTGTGNCKQLFQNWLAKNPYYVISYSAVHSNGNWGAAATNATAYIADYLWDRPDVILFHRNPRQVNNGHDVALIPAQAYTYANQLAIDRMNGHSIEYSSGSCDHLEGPQQHSAWAPVKSQITENGIVTEDAQREEYCNIPHYNGQYQNYPELHLSNNIQQCELMLRREDRSCYDNVRWDAIPSYTYVDPDGEFKTTHLYAGRGSLERAIKAIIVDAGVEWLRTSALTVAYRYYHQYHTLPGIEEWAKELDRIGRGCHQDICFGTLTHGFAPGEPVNLPPVVPGPSDS